jgi:Zn-dependent peptidase ImmA (M78 family)
MRNDALLMDLADCGSPETLVGAILRHHPDLPRRVPIEEIAASVGIVEIKDREMDGFEGALVANPEKTTGAIAVKQGAHRRRRRYTIGHELGHFLIPSHGAQMQCTSADMRERRRDSALRKREYEANRFSAGLLMPKPIFTKDMDALGTADVTHVKQLSDLYDVSLEATANRYAELSSDMCAFVFSKDGTVRYTRGSRSMPELSVRAGDRVPTSSVAARLEAVGAPSDWEALSGGVWLKTEWGARSPQVLEQTIVQANGYRVTLLYIEESEAEERDEDEALEKRWQVGFGRER